MINTIDEYREALIKLALRWPEKLSNKSVMKKEGIRDFGMKSAPGNALVQDIIFETFNLVEKYNIDKEDIESIVLDELQQYSDFYKIPELLSWDVESSITEYIDSKKRFIFRNN
jgi:hypothetical protein